jgi:hypothetical protein
MNTLTVVEISHPVIEGNNLIYRYKLIEGTMPKSGGAYAAGSHGRSRWCDNDGGRVQCLGFVVYDGDSGRHNLLSMRVHVVSADDAREPGDVYRGEPAEVALLNCTAFWNIGNGDFGNGTIGIHPAASTTARRRASRVPLCILSVATGSILGVRPGGGTSAGAGGGAVGAGPGAPARGAAGAPGPRY